MSDLLSGFFSSDPEAVCVALRYLYSQEAAATERVVSSAEIVWREADRRPWLRTQHVHPKSAYSVSAGLWSEVLFGDAGDQWAVIRLPTPMLHPTLAGVVGELLNLAGSEVSAVASYGAWLVDGAVHVPPGHPGISIGFDSRTSLGFTGLDAMGLTGLDAWPPFPPPGYANGRKMQARKRHEELNDEDLLSSWFIERGLDREAIDHDDKSWEASWSDKSGVPALLAGLKRVEEACVSKYSLKPEELFVRYVPAPPIHARPSEPTRGGFSAPGRVNSTLLNLLNRTQAWTRLVDLEAPAASVRTVGGTVAAAVADVIAAVGGKPAGPDIVIDLPLEVGGAPPSSPIWPLPEGLDHLRSVTGLAWLSETQFLIDFPSATFLVDVDTGRIESKWASPGLELVGGMDSGLAWYSNRTTWKFHFFDFDTGLWVTGVLPRDLAFCFTASGQNPYLVDCETRKASRLAPEIGDMSVVSACGKYVVALDVEGSRAVYRCDGGVQFPLVEGVSFDSPWLHGDGEFGEDEEREGLGDESILAVAYCESLDVWRSVQNNGVYIGLVEAFRFAFPVSAAAFSKDGLRLAVACESRLFTIALTDSPEIVECWDLRPLQEMLVGTLLPERRWNDDADEERQDWQETEGDRDETALALNAILYRTGTLVELAEVDSVAIAALNTGSEHDEPKAVGGEFAARIKAQCARVQSPNALEPVPIELRRRC